MEQQHVYFFGAFRLNTATHILQRDCTNVSLQPKIYKLLLFFLQHPGRLLSQQDILDSVWQGRVVENTSLRLAIRLLRLALDDHKKPKRYILTVNKQGYRFLPTVTAESLQGDSNKTMIGSRTGPNGVVYPAEFGENRAAAAARLLNAFSNAQSGTRCAVFISGDHGSGKTGIIESALESLPKQEFGLLRARCLPLKATNEPFLPLLEALERRCLATSGKYWIEFLQKTAPTWLFQMLNLLTSEELAALQSKVSQTNSGRMLREGALFFESLSQKTPFILVLDNAQWSDPATLDLFHLLSSRSSPAKLLLVLSYRPEIQRIEEIRSELYDHGLGMGINLPLGAAPFH